MLPRAQRLRDAESFRAVVRRGRRAGSRTLVVHLLEPLTHSTEPARAGLIVGKDVGSAVARNRVKRRLRHLLGDLLDDRLDDSQGIRAEGLVPGSLVVVRALPAAAEEGSALAEDLTRCLRSVRERVSA